MKILISAYACEAGRGSEGEIAWRMVHELARTHDVRVITRANLRTVHTVAFAEIPKPERLEFIYFDLPWIFRFYKRGKRFFLVYYYLWQIGVGLRARNALREAPADVLHHLTGGMDWMPSGLALCHGPFVWGPVGSENTHPTILPTLAFSTRAKEAVRVALRWTLRTFDPFTRITAARANLILSHTPEALPRRYRPKVRPCVQTGIADLPALARPKEEVASADALRLVYAGELKDWKGARIALDAALRHFETNSDAELVVIGDGPLRGRMEAAAAAHPDGARVTFLGKVPMERLVDELHRGDVFLYPSFHHGLATVVLQAMLTGLPVVCIEGDATGRAVGATAGITAPLSKEAPPHAAVAEAIGALAADEARRQVLARAARRTALDSYSYETLAANVDQAYRATRNRPL
ncbi:glycosyltransferase family 4 protein [Parvibaculum sp.]|uniref:glycosyltransferase family 4 protein n=1 Tax=Parvibaculum sp. TaxID=2024848 RepID=UPI0032973A4D